MIIHTYFDQFSEKTVIFFNNQFYDLYFPNDNAVFQNPHYFKYWPQVETHS
jgi:hypothetical protein